MGAAISAFGFFFLLLMIQGIASIPGALERWRKSRAETRFLRRKYPTVY